MEDLRPGEDPVHAHAPTLVSVTSEHAFVAWAVPKVCDPLIHISWGLLVNATEELDSLDGRSVDRPADHDGLVPPQLEVGAPDAPLVVEEARGHSAPGVGLGGAVQSEGDINSRGTTAPHGVGATAVGPGGMDMPVPVPDDPSRQSALSDSPQWLLLCSNKETHFQYDFPRMGAMYRFRVVVWVTSTEGAYPQLEGREFVSTATLCVCQPLPPRITGIGRNVFLSWDPIMNAGDEKLKYIVEQFSVEARTKAEAQSKQGGGGGAAGDDPDDGSVSEDDEDIFRRQPERFDDIGPEPRSSMERGVILGIGSALHTSLHNLQKNRLYGFRLRVQLTSTYVSPSSDFEYHDTTPPLPRVEERSPTQVTLSMPRARDPDGVLERAGISAYYRMETHSVNSDWKLVYQGFNPQVVVKELPPHCMVRMRFHCKVDLSPLRPKHSSRYINYPPPEFMEDLAAEFSGENGVANKKAHDFRVSSAHFRPRHEFLQNIITTSSAVFLGALYNEREGEGAVKDVLASTRADEGLLPSVDTGLNRTSSSMQDTGGDGDGGDGDAYDDGFGGGNGGRNKRKGKGSGKNGGGEPAAPTITLPRHLRNMGKTPGVDKVERRPWDAPAKLLARYRALEDEFLNPYAGAGAAAGAGNNGKIDTQSTGGGPNHGQPTSPLSMQPELENSYGDGAYRTSPSSQQARNSPQPPPASPSSFGGEDFNCETDIPAAEVDISSFPPYLWDTAQYMDILLPPVPPAFSGQWRGTQETSKLLLWWLPPRSVAPPSEQLQTTLDRAKYHLLLLNPKGPEFIPLPVGAPTEVELLDSLDKQIAKMEHELAIMPAVDRPQQMMDHAKYFAALRRRIAPGCIFCIRLLVEVPGQPPLFSEDCLVALAPLPPDVQPLAPTAKTNKLLDVGSYEYRMERQMRNEKRRMTKRLGSTEMGDEKSTDGDNTELANRKQSQSQKNKDQQGEGFEGGFDVRWDSVIDTALLLPTHVELISSALSRQVTDLTAQSAGAKDMEQEQGDDAGTERKEEKEEPLNPDEQQREGVGRQNSNLYLLFFLEMDFRPLASVAATEGVDYFKVAARTAASGHWMSTDTRAGMQYAFRVRLQTPFGAGVSESVVARTVPLPPNVPAVPTPFCNEFLSATNNTAEFLQLWWRCPRSNGLPVNKYAVEVRRPEKRSGKGGSSRRRRQQQRRRGQQSGGESSDPQPGADDGEDSERQDVGEEREKEKIQEGVQWGMWQPLYSGVENQCADPMTINKGHVRAQYRVKAGSMAGWSKFSPVLDLDADVASFGPVPEWVQHQSFIDDPTDEETEVDERDPWGVGSRSNADPDVHFNPLFREMLASFDVKLPEGGTERSFYAVVQEDLGRDTPIPDADIDQGYGHEEDERGGANANATQGVDQDEDDDARSVTLEDTYIQDVPIDLVFEARKLKAVLPFPVEDYTLCLVLLRYRRKVAREEQLASMRRRPNSVLPPRSRASSKKSKRTQSASQQVPADGSTAESSAVSVEQLLSMDSQVFDSIDGPDSRPITGQLAGQGTADGTGGGSGADTGQTDDDAVGTARTLDEYFAPAMAPSPDGGQAQPNQYHLNSDRGDQEAATGASLDGADGDGGGPVIPSKSGDSVESDAYTPIEASPSPNADGADPGSPLQSQQQQQHQQQQSASEVMPSEWERSTQDQVDKTRAMVRRSSRQQVVDVPTATMAAEGSRPHTAPTGDELQRMVGETEAMVHGAGSVADRYKLRPAFDWAKGIGPTTTHDFNHKHVTAADLAEELDAHLAAASTLTLSTASGAATAAPSALRPCASRGGRPGMTMAPRTAGVGPATSKQSLASGKKTGSKRSKGASRRRPKQSQSVTQLPSSPITHPASSVTATDSVAMSRTSSTLMHHSRDFASDAVLDEARRNYPWTTLSVLYAKTQDRHRSVTTNQNYGWSIRSMVFAEQRQRDPEGKKNRRRRKKPAA